MTQEIKHCKIGKYEFDLVITREIAVEALKRYPEYWKALQKAMSFRDIENIAKNNNLEKAKDSIANIDFDTLVKLNETDIEISKWTPKIVKYALPKMLKLANDNTNAEELIKYCEENNVLDDFIRDGELQQGFNSKVMEFIMLGFTKGRQAKVAKVDFAM